MVTASKQVEIGGLTPETDEQLEIEAEYRWRDELWSAIRTFIIGYIDAGTGLKGYDGCAYRLNKRWDPLPHGRPVSPAVLRAALHNGERNNFRLEWIYWFAAQSQEIAELLARHVRPVKTAEERLADLEAELREELSHKRAEAVLRRARVR
jgi:hypothetical protein